MTLEIRSDPRLSKLPVKNQLMDIGTQFGNVIYGNGQTRGGGKSLNTGVHGILGHAQTIKMKQNNLADLDIVLYIPENCEKEMEYGKIMNMVRHAKQHWIKVRVAKI